MEGLTIRVPDLVNGYVDVVETVLKNGHDAGPRGLNTKEILGATIVIGDPTQCLPIGTGRKVSIAVAAMETLQLIGGFTDPVLTCKASDAFEKVKDGGAFHGAYGPRAAPQFPRVIDRLVADSASRRAVVSIWDPAYDLYREGLHDYPCTLALEYTIRDDKLIAQTHMRSNDVWLGLAYDAFVFTQVQLTLCHILGVEPGVYIHHASSLHFYESDWEKVYTLHRTEIRPELPNGFVVGSRYQLWCDAQAECRGIVYDQDWSSPWTTHRWYRTALEVKGIV